MTGQAKRALTVVGASLMIAFGGIGVGASVASPDHHGGDHHHHHHHCGGGHHS